MTTARIGYSTTPNQIGTLDLQPGQIGIVKLQITVPQDTSNTNLYLLTNSPTNPNVYWHYPKN